MLENDLHIVYLVVPIYAAMQWPNLDWMAYLDMWAGLAPDLKRVGELVGVEERFLVRYVPISFTLGSYAQLKSRAFLDRLDDFGAIDFQFNTIFCQGHERGCEYVVSGKRSQPPNLPPVLHGPRLARPCQRGTAVDGLQEVRSYQGEPAGLVTNTFYLLLAFSHEVRCPHPRGKVEPCQIKKPSKGQELSRGVALE